MTKTSRVLWLTCGVIWLFASRQAELVAADCPGQVIPSPNTGTGESVLLSVAAISSTDMWSVGLSVPADAGEQALIEHWDGTAWNIVPAPVLPTRHQLNAVTAASPGDVWAVGSSITLQGVIEHWNGSSWSVVPHPEPNILSPLLGVAVVASNDVWAVGYAFNETQFQTLIEHWDGTNWSIVPSPNQSGSNTLHAVAARATNDVWAVGEYRGPASNGVLIEHWDGASWSIMSVPSLDGTYSVLQAVSARATDDVWAVGRTGYVDGHAPLTVTVHWDGAAWSVFSSPNDGTAANELTGVTVVAADDVWAVGTGGPLVRSRTLVEHWNGASWSIVAGPTLGRVSRLGGIVALSANDLWAVGTTGDSLTEHWNGAGWALVASPNAGRAWNQFTGIATLSVNDAWAVGSFRQPYYTRTLAAHWDGTSWSIAPTPNADGDNQLTAVAAIDVNDVWAVGYFRDDADVNRILFLHWDGASWSTVAGPDLAGHNALLAVTAISASDVWAVGGSGSSGLPEYSNRSLIVHWDGTRWNEVPVPDDARSALLGISAASATDVWAVGVSSNNTALILHWDGDTWTRIAAPPVNATYFELRAVTALTSTDIWAVGDSVVVYWDGEYPEYMISTLTMHWDGNSWSVVPSPNELYANHLVGVAAVNSNDVWAVGLYNSYEGFLEHWDGSRWSFVAAAEPPNNPELKAIAPIPGTGSVWTVGAYPDPGARGRQTLIELFGCR